MNMVVEAAASKHSNLGIIFHWGLYSVPGFMKKSRVEGNGTEWYYKRLTETSTYRPVTGHKETKEYHEAKYGDRDYFAFANDFTCSNWNVNAWMELCVASGASYVILTAKHHDGYCLWNTSTSAHNSMTSGPHSDLLAEFKSAAESYGLKFGIYYSWFEFNKSMSKQFIQDTVIPQINELLRYSPEIWWFDGHWEIKTKFAQEQVYRICDRIRKQTGARINDRITRKKLTDNDLDHADYRVYKDRNVPNIAPGVPFESVWTIGNSWGINKHNNEYKTASELGELYRRISAMGGNLLLNLGPDCDGSLDSNETFC